MQEKYVEQQDGGYWIRGTRVSLDSIVHAFKRGAAPETIRRSFPLLSLEEIYGAITFYLQHESEINAFLQRSEAEFDAQAEVRQQLKDSQPELYERIAHARQENEPTR
ncbi:MAG: hypothetical protein V7641_1049 [Blastocatellia bacterium]